MLYGISLNTDGTTQGRRAAMESRPAVDGGPTEPVPDAARHSPIR